MNPTSIRFGPAGNSDSFYAAGYKRTADAPAYLQAMGLDALEYSFGRGVRMGQETAQAIREAAQAAGIALSVHLPYFINLAVQEPEKQEKTYNIFGTGCWLPGPGRVAGGIPSRLRPGRPGRGLGAGLCFLARYLAALDQEGLLDTVTLCAETMGKINQLGSLEEVIALCRVDPRLWPAVDFGHLHCRGLGAIEGRADYAAILDALETRLGMERARTLHIHFSRMEYTAGGEKMHHTLADTQYGPEFPPSPGAGGTGLFPGGHL